MNGRTARRLRWWSNWATTSLPDPDGPVIKTEALESASVSISARIAAIIALLPTSFASCGVVEKLFARILVSDLL
jgi:hypothetical protein